MPWQPLQPGEMAIVHLSDLHFGARNDREVWTLIRQILQEIRPKLILVTGDLADTPRRKTFLRVKRELDDLQQTFDSPYYICSGNHDRFWRGNRFDFTQVPGLFLLRWGIVIALIVSPVLAVWHAWAAWLFYGAGLFAVLLWLFPMILDRLSLRLASALLPDIFGRSLLESTGPQEVRLINDRTQWTLGLVGLDSSREPDALARGFVPFPHFARLYETIRGRDWDLCICLVHHHLFSMRQLEMNRSGRWKDLFNVTCMVNSGSVLEALAQAQVDLVLHGHEHEHNRAGYFSFDPRHACGEAWRAEPPSTFWCSAPGARCVCGI